MSKVYRGLVFVDLIASPHIAGVYEHDRVVVDGVPFARVLDRLQPIDGQFYETREEALRAAASKLTGLASDFLKRAEQLREEAAGV